MSFLIDPYKFASEKIYDGVSAMYTLRRPAMSNLWTNAVLKIRRSSDSNTAYVFFNGSDVDDTITASSLISTSSNTTPSATILSTWVGTDDAYVETWYGITDDNSIDSTKRARNLTTSEQPQFISGGSILTKNGKPDLDFLTTTTGHLAAVLNSDLNSSNDWTILTVTYNNVSANAGSFFGTHATTITNLRLYTSRSTALRIAQYVNTSVTVYETALLAQQNTSNQKLLTTTLNSGTMESYYNGTFQDTVVTTGAYTNDSVQIGRRFGTNKLDGGIQEIIIFPSDKTNDLTTLHSDINTYYSIY